MRIYDVIKAKRDGKALSKEEIEFFVKGVADGSIPDYQISALLMAIFINGMNFTETADLTLAMAHSGDTVDLSPIKGKKVDKHSTGGVGDKTSLVIVPIVAACGAKVAKMSGRGLGHTGGTIDKLESIDGFKTDLNRQEFFKVVNETGASIIGQSGNLDPADKKLYALRDVTATIESLPLIVSSIMSKKIASGADCIVLDVKVGSGSFNKDLDFATRLAKTMVAIGEHAGRRVTAVLTDMDKPLGNAIGNSLEVSEAAEILKGNGPQDLKDVCLTLAAHMLTLATDDPYPVCRKKAENAIADGSALRAFVNTIKAQGGDPSWIIDAEKTPVSKYEYKVLSPFDGYITHMQTDKLGLASMLLGAGRAKKEDSIDHTAGIVLHAKTGDRVTKNQPLATLCANDEKLFEQSAKTLLGAITFGEEQPKESPTVIKIITKEDIENGETLF